MRAATHGRSTEAEVRDILTKIVQSNERKGMATTLFEIARKAGQALSPPDAFIAAIARAYDFTVATRDVKPFHSVGLKVINPWENI